MVRPRGASANANAGNAASLTDDGIRRLIKLDDVDVPFRNRAFRGSAGVEKRQAPSVSRGSRASDLLG